MPPPKSDSSAHLQLLGTPRVFLSDGEDAGLPLGKPLAALCYVALEATQVTRDDLAGVLWAGAPESRARQSVRQALWMLRKAAGDDIVVEQNGVLHVGRGVTTDIETLSDALVEGDLETAWEHWKGGPLRRLAVPDSPAFQGWADELRTRWELRLGEALLARAEAENDPAGRLQWLERALEVKPYSEVLHRERIRALLEQRNVEAAGEALDRARAVVDEPTPGTFEELSERLQALRRTRHAAAEGEERLVPEFVGRAAEFTRLATVWRSALSGRPRSAALVGPMGIGKTRLAQEFLALARSEGARVAAVKAAAAERTLRLGMAGALARDLLRMPGGAGISAASAQALQYLVPSSGNGVVPAGPAPPSGPLADALEDLIEAVADEVPLVVFVDDLQWVDPDSRTILLRLARAVSSARVLFLFTSRTEEGDAGALRALRMMDEQGRCMVVDLEPLSEAEIREMVGLLLAGHEGARTDRLVAQIVRISGGTPLVAVEVLRVLVDRELLRYAEHGWTLDDELDLDDVELPGTIHEIVANRLATLDNDELRILGVLARGGQPVRPDQAVAGTNLDLAAVERGSEQLIARGLVTRRPGSDRIELAHDSLREPILRWAEEQALAFMAGGASARSETAATTSNAVPWLLAALAVASLVLVLVSRPQVELAAVAAVRPPVGEIQVVLADGGVRVIRFEADGALQEDRLRPPDTLVASASVAVRFGPDGDTVWLGTVGSQRSGPDVVEVRPGRPPSVILAGEGDQNPLTFQWSDRWALVTAQDTSTERFRKDLVLRDRVRGETRVLLRPAYAPRGGQISPDARRILTMGETMQGPDSIVELSPAGRVLRATTVPRNLYLGITWCGELYLANRFEPGRRADAVLLTPGSDEVQPLELPVPADETSLRCSPDGRHLAALDPAGTTLLVLERATLDVLARHPLPKPAQQLLWQGNVHLRLPERLHADPVGRLEWGTRTRLRARALLSGGDVDSTGVTFRSLDPEVITVAGDTVVAISPGDGRVEVSAADWLLDTLQVSVTGEVGGATLLADPLDGLNLDVWRYRLGDGFARPAVVDGQTVLELGSDSLARYTDGWVSGELLPSPEGLTVEVDFRLDVTRNDKQSFHLIVADADPPADASRADWLQDWTIRSQVQVKYPGSEMGDFDPEMAQIVVDRERIQRLPLPGFPREEGAWTRMALQVAPDGLVSLFVDGVRVPMEPLRTDLLEARPRLMLIARAVDTNLYVRDLAVWPQVRYRRGSGDPPDDD